MGRSLAELGSAFPVERSINPSLRRLKTDWIDLIRL